ncbi:hypothetical protein IV203_024309 [Nitzschia inconspicua]|uniref:HD/PDEase domain-containing protein n=1 Tax=Nitzschia inconspicua TaxID=303405 RepID=A0A9K3PBI6_9STRA|nr:hypothetical protein IV203_024309 [Nitzschia inconspicua]
MTVDNGDDAAVQVLLDLTQQFYNEHRHLIKESHGWRHARKVYEHACHALQSCHQQLEATACLEIQMAALLHDVDDSKYFDRPKTCKDLRKRYPNAVHILRLASVAESSVASILFMIDQSYHWLIPRWADRIEAVGARGVWRCHQYNQEHGAPLSSSQSPRPTTFDELWSYATPERFEEYQQRGGSSNDMISHYYDKLLHVACPPKDIVRNSYLEQQLQFSATELIEVCLQYGCTGVVDEDYIQSLKC